MTSGTQKAQATPTTIDIAWASGVYEGEGSCWQRDKKSLLVIPQKDPWILYKLQRLFGGSITKSDSNSCYFLRMYGPRSRGFLMTVYSFLSPRRRIQVNKIDFKGIN